MLVATAMLYGRVINTVGFEPELAPEEIGAIQTGLDECIKRYGGDFEHWPAVMLIMALTSPVAIRMPEYIRKKKEEKDQPHVKVVKESQKKAVNDGK